ncbi:DHA2 family efflux MFS transporter permease subunit [Lactobacillus gasseri]|uniref:DHA2 family efflux MFS transporter permease subunit n=1 Tax=Lactobacillus gasseri TaxID=1596 RepID=UPI000668C731|nr:DHA2 family efflux MFS transporter permease subunit [Lactobacillus gasseri]MBD0888738.1 DHA2 family efflux MFS transporter permease subunit [Lactobacillus gasseri]
MEKQTKNTLAVLATAFMSFVGILTETSLNVTFPAMMKQFQVSLDTIQWTTTGYLLMIAIIMISSSYQNERFTARQLFISAAVAFIAGSMISAFASSFYILLLGRLISALGVGLCTPMMFNLIVEVMPRQRWGFYMGIAGLVIAMAPTLGPAFGGSVSYYLNWRWIFIIAAIFALFVFIAGIFVIGSYHPIQKKSFNWLAYIFLSLSLVSLVIGVNQLSKGLQNWRLWGLLILTVLLFISFVIISKKSTRKLLDLQVFEDKAFVFGAFAYFLLQFINIGVSFVLPNYIQIVNKQTSLIGGLVLLPGSIIAGLLNPYFGRLYDRLGARVPLYSGAFLMALGSFLLANWGLNLNTWMIICFYGILMLGHRMSFSNTMAQSLKIVDNDLKSDATAVCQTAQQLAGSMGTAILAAIIAIFQNKHSANYASLTAQGSMAAFYFTFSLGILILLCDWIMFKLSKENKQKKV